MRCARAAVRAATALCLHRPGVPRATLLLTKSAVVPASPNNGIEILCSRLHLQSTAVADEWA